MFFVRHHLNLKIAKTANFYRFSSKISKLDPFLILEVNRNADWPTIKKSYFKLGN